MVQFSKRMKRLLAIMLVEIIVASNVFVSYADEYNSDEPKVMAQMTELEADELAAEVEAEKAKEDKDKADDEEVFKEEAGEEERKILDAPYGGETPASEETENDGKAEADATASVIPAEIPMDETGNQEEKPEEAQATATPSETPSATPVKEEVRASVKISVAFEDTEGNALEELAEKELAFEDSMDLTEAPFSATGYEYKEARINGITVTALHVTEDTGESDVDREEEREADQSEAKEDGVQGTVTLIYSYATADGEEVVLTEDTTVTFVYGAEEVSRARVTVSVVDSFGDVIAEKYTDMDLDKLFQGTDTLILNDAENPPVSKVQVWKGLFKAVQYQYVKAVMDQKILTGLKREEVKSEDAEKKYVYSFSTDGENWAVIEEDATVLLEYTDGQKSVFTYEDDQVLVTASLQHAGAIPEDAQLVVTPVTPESGDYNYAAYMNALNANADRIVADSERTDGGRKNFTEENTLLYDVAFLAPAIDEEGNVQEDNLVEYQPAEGMVNISFIFKQNQLSDGLDARSEEDLTIVHLPLQEAVKEETATTAAATDISAADVNVEIVADSVSLNGNTDQADFCLSSFSVVAVVGGTINEDPHMTDYSLNNILNNYNYFIFGNTDTIHTVGAVIVKGDAVINAFGGASVGGSAPQKVPSYVKGKASDTFANNRATDVTDLVLYLGTTNYEAFKNAQVGPGYVGTLQNIIFTDDYVDFEAAHASIVAEAGSIKCKVHISEQDIAEMKATEYYSVTEGWSGKKILHIHSGNTYEIDSVNGLIQLDLITDNVSDANDTVVRITDSGEVTFPVTLINGKACTGEENGPGTSITWHFPSASKVNLPSDTHVGHVIAPDSDVFIAGGTYNGCVIAQNLVSKGEGHMWSYTGKIFTPAASGFKVQKQLLDTEGNAAAWPEGQTFSFVLKGFDGAPMPANANDAVKSVVVKSTGVAGFGDIIFPCDEDSAATEYHYELREVKGSQEKIIYDETVYHITVKVSYQETSGNKKAVIESVAYTTDDSQEVKTVGESFVYGFTNIYDNIEKIDIPVRKVWADGDNQDGKRPGEITVNLLANGKVVRSQKLSAGQADKEGNWSYTFTGLPEKENGQKITYTVTEEAVTGYKAAVTTEGENGFVITNSHTPEITEVNGTKTWNDNGDKENARPDSITVRVFDGDQEVASKTVTEADNWTWNFTGLPKYKKGKEIRYTVTEDHVPDYTTKVNGFNITNTYTPDETAITVVKVWDDAEDQDCKRPDSITVVLHEKWGGIFDRVRERAVLSDKNNWSVTFDKLPVNKKDKKVNYWIEELTKVPGYDTVINNPGGEQNQTTITITNSHTPETVRIDGSKKWSDYDNQEGKRPESIQVILYQNGKETDQVLTVTPDDKGNWNYSFTDLPKYRKENGRRVKNVYTVRELTRLADYEIPAVGEEDNNYVILNRMKQVTVGYSVTKNWIDDNNRDGLRKEIQVQLFADGKPVDGKTAILTAENGWSYHWSELQKYNAGDVKIEYTVAETEVPAGYNENPGYAYEEGRTVITNSHTPELVSVSGEKIWRDADDQDGRRPQAITVVLKANGRELKETTVTADNGWKWSFEGLHKYENGREIVYTAEEKAVPAGYMSVVTRNADGTFTITNSYTPETTEVSGTKIWKDAENQDRVRPDSIMVYLKNGESVVAFKKVTEAENWQYSFKDLPKYENRGKLISYTVDEKLPEGYEKSVTGADITNSYTPGKTSLTVKKHWSDAEDQDGKRPESIEVQLYADGKPVEGSKAELNEQNSWSHTWTGLDQKKAGQNISYEAKEGKVPDGYEASYNNEVTGTTEITNIHTPETISLSGSKVWSDADDQDGIRPSEIMVELYGTDKSTPVRTVKVSADAEGKWSYQFTDLPKYENGEIISYTVSETGVPEGYVSAAEGTGTEKDPFVITNTHTPEVISIAGTKSWIDGDREEEKRPSEITVNLYKNEEKKPVASRTVKAAEDGTWSYTFDDLPKYENGKEISYRVSEEAVKDYSASYNGNNIVNTYTPDKTQITVTKIWDDENNQDGKRPESVQVQLYAGLFKQGEAVTLSESNQWTYTWKNLDSTNALGFRIHYTVKEVSDRGEYKATITGDTNVIITNSYTPEVTSVKVDKQWGDYGNQENKRPESIQISLLADGEVADTVTLRAGANDTWSYTFENLPKYRNNGNGAQEIQYTVKETAMADYTSAVEETGENTFVIINTMDPVFTEYEVTKFWDDTDDQDGLRKEITVDLLADGKKVEGKTITLGTTQGETYRWTGLPKYNEEGNRILYTAREADVPAGYDENPGYVDTEGRTKITNRRNTEPTPTPGRTDPTPDPTTEVTPGITPPDEEVLGAKRVPDNAVLGARRGSDLAVLGKRRGPQTGDNISLILWLIVLGASIGTTGLSMAMQYRKLTKKDKK